MVELLNTTRPAGPGRATAASLALFLATMALAGQMSHSRRTGTLGTEYELAELGLALPVPRGLRPGDVVETRLGPAVSFFGRTEGGAEIELVARRVARTPDEGAADVCRRILSDMAPVWVRWLGRVTVPASEQRLGPWSAIEVADPRSNVVIRVATPPRGPAVAISLTIKGQRIDETHYRMFERVCREVRPLKSSGRSEATEPL